MSGEHVVSTQVWEAYQLRYHASCRQAVGGGGRTLMEKKNSTFLEETLQAIYLKEVKRICRSSSSVTPAKEIGRRLIREEPQIRSERGERQTRFSSHTAKRTYARGRSVPSEKTPPSSCCASRHFTTGRQAILALSSNDVTGHLVRRQRHSAATWLARRLRGG